MITVGGIKLKDLDELRATWTRDGDKYTSPDETVVVWIASARVSIGARVRIGAGASIGAGVSIGDFVSIAAGVRIGEEVRIGARVSIGDFVSIAAGVRIAEGWQLTQAPLWFSGYGHCHPIYCSGPGMITSGCITKPIRWWEKNVRTAARDIGKYSDAEIDEYEWRVKVLADWMKRHGLYEIPSE